jgi:AbrB family looped-hinge helix DNA binding protein
MGRVIIPARFRKKLAIRPRSEIVITLEGGWIELRTKEQGRRSAQDYVTRLAPAKASLAKELLADRRKEAARER